MRLLRWLHLVPILLRVRVVVVACCFAGHDGGWYHCRVKDALGSMADVVAVKCLTQEEKEGTRSKVFKCKCLGSSLPNYPMASSRARTAQLLIFSAADFWAGPDRSAREAYFMQGSQICGGVPGRARRKLVQLKYTHRRDETVIKREAVCQAIEDDIRHCLPLAACPGSPQLAMLSQDAYDGCRHPSWIPGVKDAWILLRPPGRLRALQKQPEAYDSHRLRDDSRPTHLHRISICALHSAKQESSTPYANTRQCIRLPRSSSENRGKNIQWTFNVHQLSSALLHIFLP